MILKYAFLAFVLWLLYKLIFDFIVPVYQSTKHVRRQMGDIQEHLRRQYQQQEQVQRQAAQAQQQQQHAASKKADNGDYLDFEEIK
jgi:Sec-independent protein translocase protein TatA